MSVLQGQVWAIGDIANPEQFQASCAEPMFFMVQISLYIQGRRLMACQASSEKTSKLTAEAFLSMLRSICTQMAQSSMRQSSQASWAPAVLSEGEGPHPEHGTLMADGINAQIHQHFFCVRMDPAVDCEQGGKALVVSEVSHLHLVQPCWKAQFQYARWLASTFSLYHKSFVAWSAIPPGQKRHNVTRSCFCLCPMYYDNDREWIPACTFLSAVDWQGHVQQTLTAAWPAVYLCMCNKIEVCIIKAMVWQAMPLNVSAMILKYMT